MNDYISIGNDELGQKVRLGDRIINTKTNETVEITKENYGIDMETGKRSESLLFYTKGEDSYLIGVAGQLISPWEKV